MGGSQGARILSDLVPPGACRSADCASQHLRVSHQARHEDIERVADFYADHGIEAEVETFF